MSDARCSCGLEHCKAITDLHARMDALEERQPDIYARVAALVNLVNDLDRRVGAVGEAVVAIGRVREIHEKLDMPPTRVDCAHEELPVGTKRKAASDQTTEELLNKFVEWWNAHEWGHINKMSIDQDCVELFLNEQK